MINDVGTWIWLAAVLGIIYVIGRQQGYRRGFREGWNLKKMFEGVDLDKPLPEPVKEPEKVN